MQALRRAILGGVFLVPGLLHIVDLSQFAWQIYQYGFLGEDVAAKIAMPLAMLELWLGASFLLDQASEATGFLAAALLGCFAVAISIVLLNERSVECGCLGVYSPIVSWAHVAAVACLTLVYGFFGFQCVWQRRRTRPSELVAS